MKVIPNTDERLFLTAEKKVYNAKTKKYINVKDGILRTRVNNKSVVVGINKLHRALFPEKYKFSAETWEDVKGFEGLYKINKDGFVLSLLNNKVLKSRPDKDGYMLLNLYKDKRQYCVKVHRLVASHFLSGEPKETVNHKDGDKRNNAAENLEWATRGENNLHSYKTGLKVQKADYMKRKVIISDGKSEMQFNSIKECSEFLKCDSSFVAKVARGKQKTCKGYTIKYITG